MSEIILKVTLMDIARELNITAATVSHALNNHPAIKESTKKMVREVAEKLQYQPNKIASSPRLGKSNIIGVIIPSAEINFFDSAVHGIEKVANGNCRIRQRTFREYITPLLSTVNQQTVQMGEEAAKLFFRSLTSNGTEKFNPFKLVLQPELICRESSIKNYR